MDRIEIPTLHGDLAGATRETDGGSPARETEARLTDGIHRAVVQVVGTAEAERLVQLASETPRIGEDRDESPVEKVQRLRRTRHGRDRLRQARTWADVPLV